MTAVEEAAIPLKRGKKGVTTSAKRIVVSPTKKVTIATPAKRAAVTSGQNQGGSHSSQENGDICHGGHITWQAGSRAGPTCDSSHRQEGKEQQKGGGGRQS